MSLLTHLRLIDHQETNTSILEVYEGPDGRRVRFFVQPDIAQSQVWTNSGWTLVHVLLDPGPLPKHAITRLFPPTEDILGWGSGASAHP